MISLVIPIYNEEEIIDELFRRTTHHLNSIGMEYEIICVNDGSQDGSMEKLLACHAKETRFKVLDLSRNFGHQAAYTAGLSYSRGEYTVMMDGDLQDPPEMIHAMLKKLTDEKMDIVFGNRTGRKEGFLKKLFIHIFHRVFRKMSNINAPANVGNFSIMNRKTLNALLSLREKNRYLPGLRYYLGFRQGAVDYDRPDREAGNAKMNFLKLFQLGMDAIFSFSKFPIKLSWIIGTIGIIISFTGGAIVLYKKIIGDAITGWTSIMLGLFFFGSVQLFFLGILGEYVFRIFTETKDRPLYIVNQYYD